MAPVKYAVVTTLPISLEVQQVIATLDNDFDVAYGQSVDGPTLDLLENLHRDVRRIVAARVDRAVLSGR